MTNAELAELRGEIFGCKILLFNCISFIAGLTDDPAAHLKTIQTAAIDGILRAPPTNIRPQHLEAFRNAAAGIVAQAIEGSTAAYHLSAPQGRA